MPLDLVVSHYRVLDAIGEGGMGEVYLALDETLKRRVALKAIRAEHRLNAATKARFLREARVLSQLDHPHICRIYDYIETPESDWIVLELIEGRTLRDAMRGLTYNQRLAVARQIADVLVVTHAAGVVHRDLKPGNVMVMPSGDVKVLDFGLSATLPANVVPGSVVAVAEIDAAEAETAAVDETRWSDSGATLGVEPTARRVDVSNYQSVAGGIKGTVAYMSPEQARGELATPASDMYSYGLVLQELFGGQDPYGNTVDYRELLAKAQRGESLAPSGMSGSLRALIVRLKALAPAQRPTALDTLDRVRWIADRPRRLRRSLAIAALVLVALAGAVRYTIDLSRERNAALAARDEADQRRGQAEGLIGFMVGDLRTKLAAVGRLDILDDVGKQALAYFASVSADTLTDEELYRRSQALHQLGQVRQARGDLPGALKAYEDSLAQAEAVVRRQPGNAEWQLGLGTSHFYVGDLKMRRDDLDGALAHFQAYKAIAERLVAREPGNFEWTLELSYGHSNIAAIHSRQGNLPAAREQLETTAALQAELAKQKPGDIGLRNSRANNYNRLATVQDGLGDLEGAAASYAVELELYEQSLRQDAKDTRVRRRLEVSHIFRGHVLRALGRTAEARVHLQTAVREAQALVALDSTNANWQRDLGVGRMAVARLDLAQGRTRAALEHFLSAIDLLGPLAKKTPGLSEAVRGLALARMGAAEAWLALGDVERAGHSIDEAQAALAGLSGTNPKDIDARRELAVAGIVRGVLWARQGDASRAAAAWTASVAALEPLARDSADRNLLEPWVRALLHLGRTNAAMPGYQKLLSIGYREPGFMRLWEQQSGVRMAAQP